MRRFFLLTLAAALILGAVCEANAGLFDAFRYNWRYYGYNGCGCCAPAPSCCTPAPTCCAPAPTCCAPAPTCCAPAPTCCAPAPTCCGSAPMGGTMSKKPYEDTPPVPMKADEKPPLPKKATEKPPAPKSGIKPAPKKA